MLIRKHARQPHARNASSGSMPRDREAPRPRAAARPVRRCARSCRRSRASRRARTRRPAVRRRRTRRRHRCPAGSGAPPAAPGAHTPIWSYVGSTPIAAVPTPMITSVQDQHLLATDPVPEVAEDQPADRPGEEPDREGGERRELRGRPVQPVEVELVEDQARGRAVEEEVVPLDRGADGRRDRHLARGRRGVRVRAHAEASRRPKPLRWKTRGAAAVGVVDRVQLEQHQGVVAGLDLRLDRAVEGGDRVVEQQRAVARSCTASPSKRWSAGPASWPHTASWWSASTLRPRWRAAQHRARCSRCSRRRTETSAGSRLTEVNELAARPTS